MPVIKEKGTPYLAPSSRIKTETIQSNTKKQNLSREEIEQVWWDENNQDKPNLGQVVLSQNAVVRPATEFPRTRIVRKEATAVVKSPVPTPRLAYIPPWGLKLPPKPTDFLRFRKYLGWMCGVADRWIYVFCWVVPLLLLIEIAVLDRFPVKTWRFPSFAREELKKTEPISKNRKKATVKKLTKKKIKIKPTEEEEYFMPPYNWDRAVISTKKRN